MNELGQSFGLAYKVCQGMKVQFLVQHREGIDQYLFQFAGGNQIASRFFTEAFHNRCLPLCLPNHGTKPNLFSRSC